MMTLRLRQCGDPGVKPSRVRKFSMKPLLLRKKLIRTGYREHVSGGEGRRENCWLHFRIDDLRYPSSHTYLNLPFFVQIVLMRYSGLERQCLQCLWCSSCLLQFVVWWFDSSVFFSIVNNGLVLIVVFIVARIVPSIVSSL
jgi:hypothetical protein